jgi:integrase
MAWPEQLPGGGYRGRYHDSAGRKQSVKDTAGRTVRYDRKSDAKLAAQEVEVKARRQAAPSEVAMSAGITWGSWWDSIRVDRAFEDSDTGTTEGYIVKNHLRPQWGETPLNAIKKKDVQRWIDSGRLKVRRGMSAATVRRVYGVFAASINRAVADDVLTASPCAGIKLPTVRKRPKPYMTDEHIDSYRAQPEGRDRQALREDYERVIRFALETGLRPGELCGLHADRAELAMRSGWLDVADVFVSEKRVIRPWPKDKDSRPVPLTTRAVEILRAALDGRDLKVGCGFPHTDGTACASELVFRTVRGGPVTPKTLEQQLRRAAKAVGAERRSPYAARRGFGTWAAQGIDAFTLQKIMGHSDMEETEGYVQLTEAARGKLLAARGEVPGLTVVPGAAGADAGADLSKTMSEDVGREDAGFGS